MKRSSACNIFLSSMLCISIFSLIDLNCAVMLCICLQHLSVSNVQHKSFYGLASAQTSDLGANVRTLLAQGENECLVRRAHEGAHQ